MKLFLKTLLLLAVLCVAARGQVVNRPGSAAANTKWLQDKLNACRAFTLPIGTLYVDGTVTAPAKVGCGRILTKASFGVGGYPTDHPNAGNLCVVKQLGSGPILRLAGNGFVCDDPVIWWGDGVSPAIEVEGRADPPSGQHRFKNQIFVDCSAWFKTLPGYYATNGEFVPDENHADMSTVEDSGGYNTDRGLWSTNQQSSGWHFVRCFANVLGTKNFVAYDCERGGGVLFERLWLNHPRSELVRLRDYSPHQCKIVFRDFFRDVPTTPDNWLTLIEHTGNQIGPWDIEISGFASTCSEADFYKVPATMPRGKWEIEVGGTK